MFRCHLFSLYCTWQPTKSATKMRCLLLFVSLFLSFPISLWCFFSTFSCQPPLNNRHSVDLYKSTASDTDLCIINFAIVCSFHSIDFCGFNFVWQIRRAMKNHTRTLFMCMKSFKRYVCRGFRIISCISFCLNIYRENEYIGLHHEWQNYKFYQFPHQMIPLFAACSFAFRSFARSHSHSCIANIKYTFTCMHAYSAQI